MREVFLLLVDESVEEVVERGVVVLVQWVVRLW
jgi:hypothetical protein